MGTTIIVKKYNWTAFFFYFVMIGNTIPTLLIVFYSLFKKNTVSNKNAKLIVCMEVLNIFLFLVSGKFNHIIEVMPFMYVVDGWIMIYLQRRVMMYNVEDSIHSSMGAQENNAYIIFDKHFWAIWIWTLPAISVVLIVFSSIWGRKKHIIAATSSLIWTLLLSCYIYLLEFNIWSLFLLGIPTQIIAILCGKLKRRKIKQIIIEQEA